MDELSLELEMTYRLNVRGPVAGAGELPSGPHTQFWEMTSATLAGPRIRATTPMSGIDWFRASGDGYGRPHVRLPFVTDDGAAVLLEYRGIVHASEAFQRAVQRDEPTRWQDQYMRMALAFETTDARYAWLTRSLFIARGRLLGAKAIEYEVYRVV
jgi:hypothetical protein